MLTTLAPDLSSQRFLSGTYLRMPKIMRILKYEILKFVKQVGFR